MADRYDLIPDLAKMIEAALFGRHDTVMYGERIAAGLGLGECDSREVIEAELRKALPAPRAADEDQPLTCVRCWNSPATRLLVIHWREETIRMLCGGCATADAADARDLPGFRMATVLTLGTLPDCAAMPGQAGPAPLTPPSPGDPAASAYLARRAACRRCGEPGLVPSPAVIGLWLSDRQGTGRGLCPDGEMHQAHNITEAAQAAGTEGSDDA